MKNKPRLYLTLHIRGGSRRMPGGEDNYHWALLITSKDGAPKTVDVLIHAKEALSPTGSSQWLLSAEDQSPSHRYSILVRILVAKIHDLERVRTILQGTPVRGAQGDGAPPPPLPQAGKVAEFTEHRGGYRAWNCISWVREALFNLSTSGALGKNAVTDWDRIRDEAMAYVERKKEQHRFDGKAESGRFDMNLVPTWDLLSDREIVE